MHLQIWLAKADGKLVNKPLTLTCGENCHAILTALRMEAPQNTYLLKPMEELHEISQGGITLAI